MKFTEATAMRLRQGQLVSLSGQDIGALTQLFSQQGAQIQRMVSQPEGDIESEAARLRQAGEDVPDLNLWYRVTVGSEAAARTLVTALQSLPSLVDEAYVEPPPVPPPTAADADGQGISLEVNDGLLRQLGGPEVLAGKRVRIIGERVNASGTLVRVLSIKLESERE